MRIGSEQVYAYVQSYKNEIKIHLRNFLLVESGKCFATKKGVALNFEEWKALKSLVQTIDLEFRKLFINSGNKGNDAGALRRT